MPYFLKLPADHSSLLTYKPAVNFSKEAAFGFSFHDKHSGESTRVTIASKAKWIEGLFLGGMAVHRTPPNA
jgi:hypothetical protein